MSPVIPCFVDDEIIPTDPDRARKTHGVPVWRTRYFGAWPNLNPLPWLHAYHSSDIPLVFGTAAYAGPSTAAEVATSSYMQDAWGAFARDPARGLASWPVYDPRADTLVKLGVGGEARAVFGRGDEFDGLC